MVLSIFCSTKYFLHLVYSCKTISIKNLVWSGRLFGCNCWVTFAFCSLFSTRASQLIFVRGPPCLFR